MVWFLVSLTLMFSPVRLWVDYRHRGLTEDSLLILISLLGGIGNYSLQIPVISAGREGVSLEARSGKIDKKFKFSLPSLTLPQFKLYLKALSGIKPAILRLGGISRRLVRVQKLVWHTELGFVDSASLGQACGGLWITKGLVIAGLGRLVRLSRPPQLRVRPCFNQRRFRTVFSSILVFPLGYIIIAAFFAIYMLVKLKLHVKRGEADVRTSNSGTDEDSHGKHKRNG